MKRPALTLAFLLSPLLAVPAFAVTPEDIARLAQAKVSDEVILAQIRADGGTFALTPDQILSLKQAGVSDAVLKAMIETRHPAPEVAPGQARRDTGTLLLVNDASEPYCVMVSAEARSVFFHSGRLRDRLVLEPGAAREIELPPGVYSVRWAGESRKLKAPLAAGGTTRVIATRLESEEYAGVHVSVLENESEVDAGMIKVFRDLPRPEPRLAAVYAPAPVYVPAQAPSCGHVTPSDRRTPFLGPWTLLGAGLGAIVGHQSGERDKGAALGAVFGHLIEHASP